ncbi:MAG: TonB family protein, partial [Deltaproteobacteria bacterium]|nr:TonB family protein [Deltaproteobacteria bacterium]
MKLSPSRPPFRRAVLTGAALAFACGLTAAPLAAQPAEPDPPEGKDSEPSQPPVGETDQVFDDKGRAVDRPKPAPTKQQITPPKPLTYVAPRYPDAAREAGIEGAVILKLTISMDGKVVAAAVHTPAGHGFDEAAREAAKKLTFEPARYANGNPFKAIIKYRYEFVRPLPVASEPEVLAVGVLRGQVLIQGVEEPLAGAELTVVDPGGGRTKVTTDASGEFALADLAPGSYPVTIAAPGYEALAVVEKVESGGELIATYRLSPELSGDVLEVFVQGDRPPREVTRRTLEQREIARIPGTSGDALRSVQSLPGVARARGLSGALVVRGSAPFDTQTFIDGVYVPLIYHFGALSSVVPTELLSKIDFYPGNYSARYGRAMGGIVDAGIRSPRGDGYHGLAQLDLIDGRLMLEGPIPLLDDWTFAAAGRRSHLDAWLGPVLEQAGAGVTVAPRYYDYQFLVERKWGDEARFRTEFFGSDDGLELLLTEPSPGEPAMTGDVGMSMVWQRLVVRHEHQLTRRDRLEAQVGLGHESIGIGIGSLFIDLEAFSLFGRAEHSHRFAESAQLNLGLDVLMSTVSWAGRLPAPNRSGEPANQPWSTRNFLTIDQRISVVQPAAYLEAELTPISRWRIVPGIRLDYSGGHGKLDPNPRVNTRFDIFEGFPRTTAKAGVGFYSQPPQPQQAQEPLGTEGIRSNRAIHYGLGLEQTITKQIEASLEGFYKQLDDLVIEEPTTSGTFVEYSNRALGNVVGAELLLKSKPDDRRFGRVAYTLSRAVQQNS